ncbi:hypothetical protein HYDPIDRAFT_115017 [Hydnomerulius pinastri MD-312]|uniref:Uncharacterized protein n=1 Tax=Hydnomerulius pinastri MD-312 TaxID=994086 RepID=A0A0C9WD40_9AGAM|nr:hypothetical protein HYDPIDRAFT_115017 [Hydnomerulius pinastri MD-312]
MQSHPSFLSSILFISLTSIPFLLSLIAFSPELACKVHTHPIQSFFLIFAPWWLSYTFARVYTRLSRQNSELYHPFGCAAQCFNWVVHWTRAGYYAFFVNMYTQQTFITTVFCPAIAFFAEGVFHSIITIGCTSPEDLGMYERARRSFGRGFAALVRMWFSAEEGEGRREERLQNGMM